MCVGEPMRLLSRDGIAGLAEDDGVTGCIDLSLLPDARPGDWILVFLGTGREVLDEGEATRIKAALAGLRAIMGGGEAGDAFADLEMRTPTLPPHLQAAVRAGRTTG